MHYWCRGHPQVDAKLRHPDTIPELIEMLRGSSNIQDPIVTAEALASIGVRGESVQDLTDALASDERMRGIVESRFPNFMNKVSRRGMDGVDDRLLNSAIANLTAEGDDARLSGLLSIAGIGPVSINAVPALNDFINQWLPCEQPTPKRGSVAQICAVFLAASGIASISCAAPAHRVIK